MRDPFARSLTTGLLCVVDQRLSYKKEFLHHSYVVADLPFQPFIRYGDAGLVLESFIAVDDNTEGFRCEHDAEDEAAKRRYAKPEMYPKAKSLMLFEWKDQALQARYHMTKIQLAEARRQFQSNKQNMEQQKFRCSQILVQGGMERQNRANVLANTREQELFDNEDTNRRVRLYFQDLMRYLLLLIFFQMALSMGPNGDPTKFDVLASFKKSYTGPTAMVKDHQTFWDYMQGQFVDITVPDRFYNGTMLAPDKQGFTLNNNFVVGDVNMRQVRSRVDLCPLPIQNLLNINHCYLPFTEDIQSQEGFGPTHQYKYMSSLEGTSVAYGNLGTPYPLNGYALMLPKDATGAREVLKTLKKNRWLDHQTRAIIVQFTVYNPTEDMVINTQLLFELPSFGGLYPKTVIRALQPIRYTGDNFIVLLVEIIVIVQVFFCLHREYTLWTDWFDHDVWRYYEFMRDEDPHRFMDWVNYVMLIVIFGLRMVEWVSSEMLYYDPVKGSMIGFFELLSLNDWDVFLQALNCSQMWFKAFKYICIFHTPSLFNEVYGNVAGDLSQFTLMFTTMACVFGQAGMIFFGARSPGFVTFNDSLYTLFNMLTGKMSAFELEAVSPGWGTVFYVFYMFSQIYCFLNYVFGIFNFALLNAFYKENEENYFGWHVREYMGIQATLIASRLSWMKFWERGTKKTAKQLEKEQFDAERKMGVEDLYVHDEDIESVKFALRHLETLVGHEQVLSNIQMEDKFGTGFFDKQQLRALLDVAHNNIQINDSFAHIAELDLKMWQKEVDPVVFSHLDDIQRISRSTRFKETFFKKLQAHLGKTQNDQPRRMGIGDVLPDMKMKMKRPLVEGQRTPEKEDDIED